MRNDSNFKSFLLSKGGKAGMIAIFYAVILGIMVALTATNSEILAFIYIALFSYFGWQSLNKITPNIFLFMPVIGWVIYFVVKFVLSIIIGMFVAPFQIAKKITNAIQDNIR